MSELKKVGAAFEQLLQAAEKIIADLKFQLSRQLHPSTYSALDAHVDAAGKKLTDAIAGAHQAASGGAPVTTETVLNESTPAAAADAALAPKESNPAQEG